MFAETVIYTFEQMNSDKSLQNIFENDESNVEDDDDDDEDIKKLQLEIKRKRKERKLRKQMVNSILSDGQSDTTGTYCSRFTSTHTVSIYYCVYSMGLF